MNSPLIVGKPPTRVVFCLPGRSFSHNWVQSWSELLVSLPRYNIQPIMSMAQDAVVYYVRNKALGGDVLRGPRQKPFNGTVDYDYMLWIDSDMVFRVEQFLRLLSYGKDIVAGLYLMAGGHEYATVRNWDEEFFKKNGYFEFLTPPGVKEICKTLGPQKLLKVDYTGFGFMLIKRGVFESLDYPWFQPVFHDIGEVRDFSSEDVSFCINIRKKGYTIYVDPRVRVGHEKSIIYSDQEAF